MPAKLPLCDDFFENIVTEQRAYFLGVLLSDGAIVRNYIKLDVHERDVDLIEKFKEAVQSGHKIARDKHNHVGIAFYSKKMAADLAKLGVVERKSLIATVPESIPESLKRHFWRGMVDGDGSIAKRRARVISLCGTQAICEGFAVFCRELVGVKPTLTANGGIFATSICGENARIVGRELYGEATVYLKRKHELWKELDAKRPVVSKRTPYLGVGITKYGRYSVRANNIYLGCRRDMEEAALLYDEYILSHRLNKPLDFPSVTKREEDFKDE